MIPISPGSMQSTHYHIYFNYLLSGLVNRVDGAIVRMFTSSAEDRGFERRSDKNQTL